MNQKKQIIWLRSILSFFVIISLVFIYLIIQRNNIIDQITIDKQTLTKENSALSTKLADANDSIKTLTTELNNTNNDLNNLQNNYRKEKDKNDIFADQISSITGTIKNLDKLSKTDEELLQKYSKVYFLNENYIPSKIRKINEKYVLSSKSPQYFHSSALSLLENMFTRAKKDKIDLKIISAYRSFDEQSSLKGQFTQMYGSGANTFSANQGYSEHQLGTTFDVTDKSTGGTYESFADTDAYAWLQKNAYQYGFILSYPKDNSFYVFEPWHWRFVGKDLASDLHRKKANFYDWDQRKIDEYLIKIFD